MNYKISKLQTRYGLGSKQSVYDRMKALEIIPVSRPEISSQALDELDKLNEFMKKNPGAKIGEFPRNVGSTEPSIAFLGKMRYNVTDTPSGG